MQNNDYYFQGLTDAQVAGSRAKFGSNVLSRKKEHPVIAELLNVIKEPMVILLIIISVMYFLTGNMADGIFLCFAVLTVAGISLFQSSRSRRALAKLETFSRPVSKVIRDGKILELETRQLVIGDCLMVEEGRTVPADGTIIYAHDFCVDESLLTGESLPVYKNLNSPDKSVFQGTVVVGGMAVATITAIANGTRLGRIGKSLADIKEEATPLERQINSFVTKMVIAGTIVFILVWLINYFQTLNFLDSLIKALTLAMSILPEEIPVAFTAFMAIGAWRMLKMGIVVKQMKTVETLGSASVICTDKTGTLTENRMSLAGIFALDGVRFFHPEEFKSSSAARQVLTMAMWASEPIPFDPMEIALHNAYSENILHDLRPDFHMVHEYPLGGRPPMMTHIFEDVHHTRIIAAKGAPEAIMQLAGLNEAERFAIGEAIVSLAASGYRILAVGEAIYHGSDFPKLQQELEFSFKGLVAFYDPPKKNIKSVLEAFYLAGIQVKIITGDNGPTTSAIARQIGLKGSIDCISGEELMTLSEEKLREKVETVNIFTRMFPEAKLRIINALKANRQIVAMTGDGVNDAPALKAAHIGIAMGKKGAEVAKTAASLILQEDDLSKIVDAIAMGRRIYANLKKAIQYIISIHIPIILTVLTPLALGWRYPAIFTPLHIIFLELIMGPTCSIIYENEPMEENTMQQRPRPFTTTFFNWKELSTSIFQGLMITLGTLGSYRYALHHDADEATTRTMVFVSLITANIFLTLVNRSFFYSLLTVITYKNNMVPFIIAITTLVAAALISWPPFAVFFGFSTLSSSALLFSITTGFVSVAWFEVVKLKIRYDHRN